MADGRQESELAVFEPKEAVDTHVDETIALVDSLQVQEDIEAAKVRFRHFYHDVQSMNCSLASVHTLETSYHKLQELGIKEEDINALCAGKDCQELIRYYKLFFSELDHGTLESFVKAFNYPSDHYQSKTVKMYFSKQQQGFIAILVQNSDFYKHFQTRYKGVGIAPKKSFIALLNQ